MMKAQDERRQDEEARRLEMEEQRRREEELRRVELEAQRREDEIRRQAQEEDRRAREEQRRREFEQEMQQRHDKMMELLVTRTEQSCEPHMPRAKLHKFVESSDDIEAFLEGFEATATAEKWPKNRWTGQLVTVLSGEGLLAYSKLDAVIKENYDEVKKQVLEAYSVSADMYRMRFLENSYDRKNPKQWGRWVELQLDRWVQARDMDAYTLLLLERLLQQLPQRLQVRMRELQHHTFEDLIQSVCAYESAWVAEERSGRSVRGGLSKTPKPSEKTPAKPEDGSKPPSKHKPRDTDPATKQKSWDPERGPKCYGCQQWGHIRAKCPEAESTGYGGQFPHDESQSQWLMDGAVNGNQSTALLLETGATRTFVHPRMLKDSDMLGWKKSFKTASDKFVSLPMAKAHVEVAGKEYDLNVAVSDSIEHDALLGNDLPDLSSLLIAAASKNCEHALAVTRAQSRKQQQLEEKEEQRELEDEVCTTSLSTPSNKDPEGNIPIVFNFDSSLFKQIATRKRLSRAQKRRQSEEFARVQKATHQRPEAIDRDKLVELQRNDPMLKHARELANDHRQGYHWKEGLLMRCKTAGTQADTDSVLVLPQICREEVLKMAHSSPIDGHFGRRRTLSRLSSRVDWPGMVRDVVKVCKSCPNCRRAGPVRNQRVPLQPLPVIDVPFRRMAMDIFGPLKRTKSGHKYVLVIMDYATKWPEAIPLKVADSESVARALIEVFSRLGIPEELLTDKTSPLS